MTHENNTAAIGAQPPLEERLQRLADAYDTRVMYPSQAQIDAVAKRVERLDVAARILAGHVGQEGMARIGFGDTESERDLDVASALAYADALIAAVDAPAEDEV